MEAHALKLMAYFGLLAVLVYAVFSALGRRDQLTAKTAPTGRVPIGSVSARKSVPCASSLAMAAGVYPTPPVGLRGR
jgi:hypothetical protein